jgi:hypothetical protein
MPFCRSATVAHEREPFPVRTERDRVGVESDRNDANAVANAAEVDRDIRRLLLVRRSGRFLGALCLVAARLRLRLLAEEIAELLLAKFRCNRNDVDADDLRRLGALAGDGENVLAVAAPDDRIGVRIRQEGCRLAVAAGDWDDVDVAERVRAVVEIRDGSGCRREIERLIGEERRAIEPAARNRPLLVRGQIGVTTILVVVFERQQLPSGENRGVSSLPAANVICVSLSVVKS